MRCSVVLLLCLVGAWCVVSTSVDVEVDADTLDYLSELKVQRIEPTDEHEALFLQLEAKLEAQSEASLEVNTKEYHADSGGCTPLVVWEHYPKDSYWWNWEKRLPDLARRIESMSDQDASITVFSALGDNLIWMQYVDGWAHQRGPSAFGPEYVDDNKHAHRKIVHLIKSQGLNPTTFNVDFYDHMHSTVFKQTAHLLSKRNGFRGPDSWIYLPMPDKWLGIYHDIHNYGHLNYDPRLRVVDKMLNTWGLKYNHGFQYRWVYPNIPWWFGPAKVKELFNKFWWDLSKVDHTAPIAVQREAALQAVTLLYHSLENFHCFVDGNGRSNMLVLQTLLSWIGLHPVSFYNSMESALSSVEEMREKILEGYFFWEYLYLNGKTGWTIEAMDKKGSECARATQQLEGHSPRENFGAVAGQKPDTVGGCTCSNVADCDRQTFNGEPWCDTDGSCTWKWDYCAGGRRQST